MTYGVLGPSGYMALGRMAQAGSPPPRGLEGLPRTVTPEPPQDPEKVEARSEPVHSSESVHSMARLLNNENDSNSRGDELNVTPGNSGLFDSRFVAVEPGEFSLMGLSTGTAFDPSGRGYDTTNFDVGAAIGGLFGGVAGPIGGLAGNMLGRQADANLVLDAERNRSLLGPRADNQGYSRLERRAQQEWRDWWNERNPGVQQVHNPNIQGTPALEQKLAQYQQDRDSASRGPETSWGSGARASRGSSWGPSYGSRDRSTRGLY